MITHDDQPVQRAPFWYRAHGLTIRSQLFLPELAPTDPAGSADLDITLGPAALQALKDAHPSLAKARERPEVVAHGAGAFLDIPGAASFHVPETGRILITPDDDADPKMLVLYTLGSALGLSLILRHALVLHGAAVEIDGKATLFLGPSGAGKSTLAAHMARHGHPVLGDDTIALWPDRDGRFHVYPAARSFKLWRDALEAASLSPDALSAVADRAEKFYLPNPRPARDRPHDIGHVYLLERSEEDHPPSVERLDPLNAVRLLTANSYRPEFDAALNLAPSRFRQVCALTEQAPVSRLTRPWNHAASPDVARLILDTSPATG